VKNLKGYAGSRKTLRFSIKQLTNVTRGYASFIFFCVGVREQKKVGNRCSNDTSSFRQSITDEELKQLKAIYPKFTFFGMVENVFGSGISRDNIKSMILLQGVKNPDLALRLEF